MGLPIGFDIDFPIDLNEEDWEILQHFQETRDISEFCPTKKSMCETTFHFQAVTGRGQRFIKIFGLYLKSVTLIY